MEPEKFWSLSFYDWSLWLCRIKSEQMKRKQDRELLIELERNTMALHANMNRDAKQKPEPFTGQDFYVLSYDEIKNAVEQVEKLTAQQIHDKMIERFKNKPPRNRG